MGAISGDINSLSMYCVDAADLASRPIASMKSGDRAFVNSLREATTGARFFLDRSSTAAPNGATVIAALGGVGRWLSEGALGGLPSTLSVYEVDVLAFTPSDTTDSVNGATVTVQKVLTTENATSVPIFGIFPAYSSIQEVSGTVIAQSEDGLNFFKQDVEAFFHVDVDGTVTQVGTNTTTTAKTVGTGSTLAISLDPVGPADVPISLKVTGNAGETWLWTASVKRVWRSA